MKTFLRLTFPLLLVLATTLPGTAMISVGNLTKEEAAKMGLAVKSRPNGDAGTMVWLEFKKEGFLAAFTYAELRMVDAEGKHRLSARLEPRAVVHGQSKDLVSVSFSGTPAELKNCSFLVVAYGSNRGDVGYYVNVKDFVELPGDAD